MSCGMMFFLFGAIRGSQQLDSVETELERKFAPVLGTLCYAAGLYYTSRILRIGPKGLKWIPKTDAGKQFENIKNIQDKNEKEKLAYESLVALAQISKIKKESSILMMIKKADEKFRLKMTIEEKALDDYLNQIPI